MLWSVGEVAMYRGQLSGQTLTVRISQVVSPDMTYVVTPIFDPDRHIFAMASELTRPNQPEVCHVAV